jgi:hypothetical protein
MMRLLLPILVLATTWGIPRAADAQAPRLVVSAGDLFDVAPQAGRDLVEESAWIAQDFGGFEVFRDYELATLVPAATADQATRCGADASCLVDALFGRSIDYVLVVSTVLDGATLVVHYELVDVQVGIRVGDTYAFLDGPADFASLVGPCEDALDRAPDAFVAPTPAPTAPPVQVVSPSLSPPVVEARPTRSGPTALRRAGRVSASIGGALLFGGVLAGFSADEVQQQIQAEPHPRDELERLQQRGESRQRLANVAFGVGGAALATGISLIIVDAVRDGDAAPQYTLSIAPTGSGGRVALEF